MTKYLYIGGGILVAGLVIAILLLKLTIADLKADKKQLKADKAQLTADLNFSNNQIQVLTQREKDHAEIRKSADTARSELRDKENGPVADVLRHAVSVDVVRGEP